MQVVKRNGRVVDFDRQKIVDAISKANTEVANADKVSNATIDYIADSMVTFAANSREPVHIEDIQDKIEGLLMREGPEVAKCYIRYRYKHKLLREFNTTDKSIKELIDGDNDYWNKENSNKNARLATTQRDYIAGITSTDITRRLLLPEDIVKAHDEGIIHFHDADYFVQHISNCELINLEDMLQNGTMINNVRIDKPHKLLTAMTIATQIITAVTSSTYGGATITLTHLAPFVRDSYNVYLKKYTDWGFNEEQIRLYAAVDLKKEIKDAVQTFNYQINSMSNSNGQSPFLSVFMYLNETTEYKNELAMLIEEFLNQRILGFKNACGVYITPAFPKLLYVLEDDNIREGTPYWYLTELAAKCTAKRMVPDYISEKKMLEYKIDKNGEGHCYACMGCVDGQEMIVYRFNGHTYMESFERMWNQLIKTFDVHEQSQGSCNKYMDCTNLEIYDSKHGFIPCYRLIRNRQSKWMQVTFHNGRTLRVTDDHPFETENRGVVLAKDLTVEDTVMIRFRPVLDPVSHPKTVDPNYAWMLGLLLCDGCYDGGISVSLAAHEEDEIAAKFTDCVRRFWELDTNIKNRQRGAKGNYQDVYVTSDYTSRVPTIISTLNGLFGGKQKNRRHIPNDILEWDYMAQLAFLAGMIDGDGYINSNSKVSRVQIGSTNKELALGQMYLAQELGMKAYIYENHYSLQKPDAIRYRVEFVPTQDLIDLIVCNKKKAHYQSTTGFGSGSSNEFVKVSKVEAFHYEAYSYDVTTKSEHFEVSGVYSHNCRSFLTPYVDSETNQPKYYGRFNQGVVTINLVDVALSSGGDFDAFWKIFDERLELCHRALQYRHERLAQATSDVAPILWQYGALARLKPGESIHPLLHGGYSTISLGYAGLYECVKYMTGKSHTDPTAKPFALDVMKKLNDKCTEWREAEDIAYSVYGTPLESCTFKFAKCLQKRFGIIPGITDKDYITNSYHIHVTEKIDAFTKLKFESEFQQLSPGGAISYIETPNMQNNIPAVLQVMQFIYDNIMYAELNTKSDYCQCCGFDGEMQIDDNMNWYCPNCGNRDQTKMNVARRTCGL